VRLEKLILAFQNKIKTLVCSSRGCLKRVWGEKSGPRTRSKIKKVQISQIQVRLSTGRTPGGRVWVGSRSVDCVTAGGTNT